MSTPPKMNLSPWDAPPLEPLPLLHPRDIWAAAKQIDGLGGEWSYMCFNYRALNFHLYRTAPLWFEPLRGFDELYQEAYFRALADQLGVPAIYTGNISATLRSLDPSLALRQMIGPFQRKVRPPSVVIQFLSWGFRMMIPCASNTAGRTGLMISLSEVFLGTTSIATLPNYGSPAGMGLGLLAARLTSLSRPKDHLIMPRYGGSQVAADLRP